MICWCGAFHPPTYWHDGSHGQVDRDVQDYVNVVMAPEAPKATRWAIQSTLQAKRARGHVLSCDGYVAPPVDCADQVLTTGTLTGWRPGIST